jgi:pyruvate-formate lyase-activating enzyme
MAEVAASVVPTKYWHTLEDGRVQCDMCPRYCHMREGQRGMCFVRMCQDGKVVLTTYGRSSGFCVDPIEKKPLNHFHPGTPVLSFGTAGCNLACKFCQNWDISKSREIDTLADTASPEGLADAAAQLGCASVAFTYNDPVIFHEYAIDVAQACRERGIKTVAVTAGYVCDEPRQEFYRHMDAANVDLKAFTEDFYWQLTKGHIQPVLDTLVYLKHETDVWFEVTTLVIPRSTPTSRCWTCRPRRRLRSAGRAASRSPTACATPTPATCTTPRVTAPCATSAARWSSRATGTSCGTGTSPTTAAAPSAAPHARVCSMALQEIGARSGCRCGSDARELHVARR